MFNNMSDLISLFSPDEDDYFTQLQENIESHWLAPYQPMPYNALINTVKNSDYELAEMMLMNGANPNACTTPYGTTALNMALFQEKYEYAELLLSYGANPNYKDKDDWTPTFFAVTNPDIRYLELFISYGANLNLKDKSGNSITNASVAKTPFKNLEFVKQHKNGIHPIIEPLQYIQSNNVDALEDWLNDFNNQINIGDEHGNSLLHHAILLENKQAVELLVNHDIHINRQNFKGNTALHLACEMNDDEMTDYLMQHGALNFIRNAEKERPIDLTTHQSIKEALTEISMPIKKEVVDLQWTNAIDIFAYNSGTPVSDIIDYCLEGDITFDGTDEEFYDQLCLCQNTQQRTLFKLALALNVLKLTEPTDSEKLFDIDLILTSNNRLEVISELLYWLKYNPDTAINLLAKKVAGYNNKNYDPFVLFLIADLCRHTNIERDRRVEIFVQLSHDKQELATTSISKEGGWGIEKIFNFDNIEKISDYYYEIIEEVKITNIKKLKKALRFINFYTLNPGLNLKKKQILED